MVMSKRIEEVIEAHVAWYKDEAFRLIYLGMIAGQAFESLTPEQLESISTLLAMREAESYRSVAEHFAKHAEEINKQKIKIEPLALSQLYIRTCVNCKWLDSPIGKEPMRHGCTEPSGKYQVNLKTVKCCPGWEAIK